MYNFHNSNYSFFVVFAVFVIVGNFIFFVLFLYMMANDQRVSIAGWILLCVSGSGSALPCTFCFNICILSYHNIYSLEVSAQTEGFVYGWASLDQWLAFRISAAMQYIYILYYLNIYIAIYIFIYIYMYIYIDMYV